jgi:hypothetical protein
MHAGVSVAVGATLTFFSHLKLVIGDVCCWLLLFGMSLCIFNGVVVKIAILDGPICQTTKLQSPNRSGWVITYLGIPRAGASSGRPEKTLPKKARPEPGLARSSEITHILHYI